MFVRYQEFFLLRKKVRVELRRVNELSKPKLNLVVDIGMASFHTYIVVLINIYIYNIRKLVCIIQ